MLTQSISREHAVLNATNICKQWLIGVRWRANHLLKVVGSGFYRGYLLSPIAFQEVLVSVMLSTSDAPFPPDGPQQQGYWW